MHLIFAANNYQVTKRVCADCVQLNPKMLVLRRQAGKHTVTCMPNALM